MSHPDRENTVAFAAMNRAPGASRRPRRAAVTVGLVIALASAVLGCRSDPPLDTVSSVDLNRFQGQWFEIASFPRATQQGCQATTATYRTTSSTSMDVLNQCHLGSLDGPVRQASAHAVMGDTNAPGRLSVDFGGFYGDYWIIDLGANYEFAVVGHPSRDYLWILSRTPSLDATVLAGIVARAQAKGFDVGRIVYTPQAT
jgi:apolipoprotein D and lipocalin family protein